LLLAGVAFYGAVAIMHDMAHDSFLPSKQANLIFGRLLAPLLLMEFLSFRKSHLAHHRYSQSSEDPKRFGAERTDAARLPEYRTIEHVPSMVRPLLQLGDAVATLPLRVRHSLYLGLGTLLMGPVLLTFGGEFSLPGRDWRHPRQWLAVALSLGIGAALYSWSPSLMVMWLMALSLGYSCTFSVFAGHVTPNQVYWLEPRKASVADSLNVSDVHLGRLGYFLGHGFANHHSTHHLSPSIPCYRLAKAAGVVAADVAPFQAPPVNLLDPAGSALLFDNLILSFTLRTDQVWDIKADAALRRIRPLE
jgi:fatty acid desaturase